MFETERGIDKRLIKLAESDGSKVTIVNLK